MALDQPRIPVDGILEVAALGALLTDPANAALDPTLLYWDFATDKLMHGPEGSRTEVTTPALVWLNCYGTGYSPSQEETTTDRPAEWGDANQKFGDKSDVTAIAHTFSLEAMYRAKELFWRSLRVTKDQFGVLRYYYARFFPDGKKGGSEVRHGVVENRNVNTPFTQSDYTTLSVDFPYKSREYITDLPTVYPPDGL